MSMVKKRLLRAVCAFLVCVTVISGTTYKSYAMAPGVMVLEGAETFAAILAFLGLTAASDAAYSSTENVKAWGQEQMDAFSQWAATSSSLAELGVTAIGLKAMDWATKAGKGMIDTGSEIWSALKEWCGSIYASLTVSPSYPATWGRLNLLPASGHSVGYGTDYRQHYFYGGTGVYAIANQSQILFYSVSPFTIFHDFFEGGSFQKTYTVTGNSSFVTSNGLTVYRGSAYRGADDSLIGLNDVGGIPGSAHMTDAEIFDYILKGAVLDTPSVRDDILSRGGVGDIYERDKSLQNVGLTGVGVGTKAGDVPIDWAGFGDIAGTLEGVRTGVLDIADAMAGGRVWATDTTRDTVIDSDKDLDNDLPITDVVPGANVSDYTISGLQDVFPFCIPFDLIDFLNVLDAEPEAPRFVWDFEYMNGKVYRFDIDLSRFDTVAAAFRTFELLAFCLALILITRDKMIKG